MLITKPKTGFTLIELLLVMGIFGVMTSIVIIAINPSAQLALSKNAKRRLHINQLEKAITQFITDGNAFTDIPIGNTGALNICQDGVTGVTCSITYSGIDLSALAPDYLIGMPVDPTQTGTGVTNYYVYIHNNYPKVCSPEINDNCGNNGSGSSSSSASSVSSSSVSSSSSLPTSEGPNSPTLVANNATTGVVPWLTPTNATVQNDTDATAAITILNKSQYLAASDFGFSIPISATITGIVVEIDKAASGIGVSDEAVRIIKGGVISTTDKSNATAWPATDTDTYVSYGSTSDLWGETWTPADINSSSFGVALRAKATAGIASQVDHIRISVHYTN